jgi:antitoxin component YwqK of YwqJK toxin-antitoxin module
MRKITITFLTIVLCLVPSIALSETVAPTDLVKRNGIYYKKLTNKPYSGYTKGKSKYGFLEQGTVNNGRQEGVWEYYWTNGLLGEKGTYKDGKQDGIWKSYDENGQLAVKGTYKNDKLHGLMIRYHKNGQLYQEGTFSNNKRDGVWKTFYENGQLQSKITWKNGKYIKSEQF